MMRRSGKKLEEAIRIAATQKQKALAYYNLALFHDNNSRELEAIPFYKEAIKLGLDKETEARALAWLASSLYKTGKLKEAVQVIEKSLVIAKEESLISFLKGLRTRVV